MNFKKIVLIDKNGIGRSRETMLKDIERIKKKIGNGHRTIEVETYEQQGFDSIDIIEKAINGDLVAFIETMYSFTCTLFVRESIYKYNLRSDGGVDLIIIDNPKYKNGKFANKK